MIETSKLVDASAHLCTAAKDVVEQWDYGGGVGLRDFIEHLRERVKNWEVAYDEEERW